jgi:hypothetical protein
MKPIKLSDLKDAKEYGVKSLANDVLDIHDSDGIEMMAVVYKKNNGTFGFGTTCGNNAEFVGLLEMGKFQLINEMDE